MSSRRRYNIVKANIKQFSNPRRHSKHRRQHVSFRMDTVKPIGLGGGNGGSNSMTAPPPPPLPNKQSSTADDKIPADHDPPLILLFCTTAVRLFNIYFNR